MPKCFKFSFIGQPIGAIGETYGISENYTCASMPEALFMLYTDYQHVRILSAWRGKEKLPIPGATNVPLKDNGYKGKNFWNTQNTKPSSLIK